MDGLYQKKQVFVCLGFFGGGGFAHFLVSDHGAIDTIVLWDIIAFRGLLLADQRLEDLVRLCACESPQ